MFTSVVLHQQEELRITRSERVLVVETWSHTRACRSRRTAVGTP
jgi:hypothetical protein